MNFFKSRYLVFLAFLALVLFSSCNDNNSVLIRLKITSSKDSKVYLDKLDFSKSTFVDSVEISKGENNVSFRTKAIPEPTFFVLRIKGYDAITLLSEPGEKMDIIMNDANLNDYAILSSKGSLKTKELARKLNDTKSKLNSLRLKFNFAQDPVVKSMIDQEFKAVIDSQRAYSTRFIWANPMSRASVMAVYQKLDENRFVLDRQEDLVLLKTVASSLRAFYPNSDYAKGMIADIEKINGNLKRNAINRLIEQAKPSIPEIALPNLQGRIVKLSSLKGKVVLLDFWASWNQSSIMDNREFLSVYSQYKNQGFEIYQVSLDSNREDWLNAIESAGLPWINVCELNPAGSRDALTYNVTQLPTNYLIDRDQTIIGKNLYGESLKKKLREVL